MNNSLFSNPKRVTQMLWLAAGILFFIAVFHSTGLGSTSQDFISSTVKGVTGGGQRASIKEYMRLAEASWLKTVKQRHELIAKDWGVVDKMPLYAAHTADTYFSTPYTVWDFTPASYGCPHEMERVGRMGDGGKWVCGMSKFEAAQRVKPCVIYSFGVRDESSFENEMLSRLPNCEVWAYDFSVVDFGEQLESGNRARAKFMQVGIAGKTDKNRSPPFYSIADLMKMNGHDYIDILKMDIEFAEYESMDGLSKDFPASQGYELPIGQLMIELHLFPGKIDSKTFLEWWERLEVRGLRPAWTEPNLIAVTMNANGDKDPNMAEYTMINVKDKRNVLLH